MKKDQRILVQISKKMLADFNSALAQNEETKSEVIRACIREYIKKNISK
jgi:metal-responsive CopG/Arc/MetJ family transcriptional regulator